MSVPGTPQHFASQFALACANAPKVRTMVGISLEDRNEATVRDYADECDVDLYDPAIRRAVQFGVWLREAQIEGADVTPMTWCILAAVSSWELK